MCSISQFFLLPVLCCYPLPHRSAIKIKPTILVFETNLVLQTSSWLQWTPEGNCISQLHSSKIHVTMAPGFVTEFMVQFHWSKYLGWFNVTLRMGCLELNNQSCVGGSYLWYLQNNFALFLPNADKYDNALQWQVHASQSLYIHVFNYKGMDI